MGITSAWYTSNTATNTISGTSMATPHVAGAAALVLAGEHRLHAGAGREHAGQQRDDGVVGNPGTGSPNRLLFTTDGATAPPPPPPPPGCSATNGTDVDIPDARHGVQHDRDHRVQPGRVHRVERRGRHPAHLPG